MSDNLVRSSGLMFFAFMATSVFNYLFQIVLGRLLGPSQYGFLNGLLSLFSVLGVPVATLLMVVSSKSAEYKAMGDSAGLAELFSGVTSGVLKAGAVGLALFLAFSPAIKTYLNAPELTPVLLMGLAAFAALLGPVNTAMLQGVQDYKWLAVSMTLGGPARLGFSALPVLAGFGVNGAVGGLVLTGAFVWLITYLPLRRHVSAPAAGRTGHLTFARVLPVFIANLSFTVMTQSDIVLVNRYFQSGEAGIYAAAAILGRAVMYIPGAIVLAMFPMVSESRALNKSGGHLLVKSLFATALFSGGGAALFYFLPEWTMGTFFGAGYLPAAPLLKYFGLAMLPMAFLLVFMNYFVAREKTVFAYIMAACAALELVGMHLYHAEPLDIVKAVSAAGLLALAGGVAAQKLHASGATAAGEGTIGETK